MGGLQADDTLDVGRKTTSFAKHLTLWAAGGRTHVAHGVKIDHRRREQTARPPSAPPGARTQEPGSPQCGSARLILPAALLCS